MNEKDQADISRLTSMFTLNIFIRFFMSGKRSFPDG